MTTEVHDSGYKKLFSNRTIIRQLIETFIHESWVKELDFEHCETVDKSFISDHYKETESDLIYKIYLHGKTIYIYILLEFQSKVDRFMALRVLNYLTSFYLDYITNHKRIKKLPAIFPIVLYNGKRKWTAKQKINELIETEPSLGEFALNFQYLLINERTYSKGHLLKIRNIVSTLFLAEGHYEIELLEKELLNLYEREEDKQAVSLFLNWFKQLALYGKVSPEDYGKLDYVYRTKEEVKTMLMQTLEQERKNIYHAGLVEGRVEGLVEGRVEGLVEGLAEGVQAQRQTLLQFIGWRFQPTASEQANLAHQLTQINDLHQLSQLTEVFLQSATLEEFAAQLTRRKT